MEVSKIKDKIQCYQWDIFCHVVDNYGDIGVCWRLARLLSQTYQQRVRLWVDNLSAFAAICQSIDPQQPYQQIDNITIHQWNKASTEVTPAEIVIATFACSLPDDYLNAMVQMTSPPLWINLEYLTAEPWIEDCHGLASPHPTLPLTQYFFFPGFLAKTGGILYEPARIQKRVTFQNDHTEQQNFWKALGLPPRDQHEKRISLFCYDNPRILNLLSILQHSDTPYTCLVPQGPAEKTIATFFSLPHVTPYTHYQQGNVHVYILPFLEQDQYDQLLWACDINFVRGEDSFIRAQLAARPFIWHIYPQEDNTHWPKLDAFLNLYAPDPLPIKRLWHAWNGNETIAFAKAWEDHDSQYPALQHHAQHWTTSLIAKDNLAAKLILFCENKLK